MAIRSSVGATTSIPQGSLNRVSECQRPEAQNTVHNGHVHRRRYKQQATDVAHADHEASTNCNGRTLPSRSNDELSA